MILFFIKSHIDTGHTVLGRDSTHIYVRSVKKRYIYVIPSTSGTQRGPII